LSQDAPHHAAPIRPRLLTAAVLAVLAAQSPALAQSTEDAFVVKIPGASMTSSVAFSLTGEIGTPGQTVQVPINLTATGTAAAATFQMDLSFDQTKLTFTAASAGAQMIAANKNISSTLLANGNVRLVATGINQTAIANGLAAYATFTLNAQFLLGSTTVTPLNCTSASGLGSALSTACTGATVTAFTCDINGDGKVDVTDVQLLVNEVLGVTPPVNDLNHDGVVNVLDLQKLLMAVQGQGCPY
jgi:hypothetical protein